MSKITIYDPPSGWMYGFPRPYKPLPGESLQQTLLRDGYPAKEAEMAAKHTRFWEHEEEPPNTEPDDDGGPSDACYAEGIRRVR